MSNDDVDNKTRAFDLVKQVSEQTGQPASYAEVATLVNALEEDLNAADAHAKLDEERLAKVEAQTRVLAEAVIAIAAPGHTVAPAVRAVKDKM